MVSYKRKSLWTLYGHMIVYGRFLFDDVFPTQLLSYLDVVALRVDALKKGPHLVAKRIDERLAHAITFCEEMCGNVDLKQIVPGNVLDTVWMSSMQANRCRNPACCTGCASSNVLEQLNRATHSNFLSGSLLASLAAAHVDYLDFSAFPGMLVAVIGITASDICNFINGAISVMASASRSLDDQVDSVQLGHHLQRIPCGGPSSRIARRHVH
uniref:Solute carrier family 40 protein n=1 Tax=Angiostrongylus cantonensis TaxID=6313 RepID=A0A158P7C1_ANGCA